jgi:hypothetical protein
MDTEHPQPDAPALAPPFDVPALEAELAECEAYLANVQNVRDRAIRIRGQLDVLATLNYPAPADEPDGRPVVVIDDEAAA